MATEQENDSLDSDLEVTIVPPADESEDTQEDELFNNPRKRRGKVDEFGKPMAKRGVKIINQFGQEERKKRAVSIGISDMMLPPITRKSIATYRIIGTNEINRSTGEPVEPVDTLIPGTYMLFDQFEPDFAKKNKLFKNLSRPDIRLDKQTGKQFIDEDLINDLIFVRGIYRVDPERQFRTYVFLELHPLNKTNKFRNKEYPPLFERVDLQTTKSLARTEASLDLAFEAEAEVRAMKDSDQIVAYATNAGIPVANRPPSEIKLDLRTWARNNPMEFFSRGGDLKTSIKMKVLDALQWGIIEIDPTKKQIRTSVTNEPLHVYHVGEDPVESYVDFLSSSEGQDQYQAIRGMVDFWS